MQENVVTKEEEEEFDQTSMQVSHVSLRTNDSKMRNGDKNQKFETKMKRENFNGQRGNSESFDLSEFITNYLNKTYKNVIENSS